MGLAAGKSGIAVEEPGFSQPLPPSSFQRFLRAQPIPGLVIEDHPSAFTNRWLMAFWKDTSEVSASFWIYVLCSVFRFYESMYDNAEYLNVSYPPNMTQEEQLDFLTDTAKVLMLITFTHLCWLKQLVHKTPFILSLKYIFLVLPWFLVLTVTVTSWKIVSIFVSVSFSLWQRWPPWWLGLCTCRLEEQSPSWTTLMLTLKQYDFPSYFVNLKCLTLQDAAFLFDNWSVNQHGFYCKCIFVFVYIVHVNIL